MKRSLGPRPRTCGGVVRIAIDYTSAIAQQEGVGRYTRSLVAAMVRLDGTDRFTLFSGERPLAQRSFPEAPNTRRRIFPVGGRATTIMWQRARLPVPIELFTGPADIMHGPDFALPPALGVRRIVTIHDLAYLTVPEVVSPKNVAYLQSTVRRAVARADHVVTDSRCTADDLIALLGVPRERVSAIHLGIDQRFAPVRDAEKRAELDARLELVHPLVLAVGTIEPRKRYDALIAAFARARTQPGGPRMLAIAGPKRWRAEETVAAASAHGVADDVRFLDFIAEADLATLYSTADVLAMPARYEGFGLPVVEAMACGTPVVCSNTGSLPEVAGDAALVVDVAADGALADALVRAASDADLRARLRERGIERAAQFTWERAARQTLDIYGMVAAAPKRRAVAPSGPRQ